LLSLQLTAAPAQVPAEQVSGVVQSRPSLQVLLLSGVAMQPAVALHESSVHSMLSLQTRLPEPTQTPLLLQPSVGVQTLPSVQLLPARVALPTLLQAPVVVLQLSKVHGLVSAQFLLLV
jgi:hypothetical protein